MRMRSFALAVLSCAAVGAPSLAAEDFAWRGRVPAGKAIEVKGLNGGITASPANGDEVEVTAHKSARRSDPDEVEVKVVEHGGGVTICAVYPTAGGSRADDCQDRRGQGPGRGSDVKVDFTVRVPAGVRFVGRTVNGGIEAEGLTADAEVLSVNGGVVVSTAGVARAETVNGSVRASMGRADWKGPLQVRTVNGSVTVELPEGVGAEVEARTVNGAIATDFLLTGQRRVSRRHLSGTIGSGGRRLELETVNGSISLRRR